MRFIAPILLSILSYASLGSTAAQQEDSFDEKYAQIRRTSDEWERRAQTQGMRALDSIQEAALHKLRSAWISYMDFQISVGHLQQAAAPSPDVLVQTFIQTCPTQPLSQFITDVCGEWTKILQRHQQLETLIAQQKAKEAFGDSQSAAGNGRKRSPSSGSSSGASSPIKPKE